LAILAIFCEDIVELDHFEKEEKSKDRLRTDLCDVGGAVEEDVFDGGAVEFLEAEEEIDGVVGVADLLHAVDLGPIK
jgi:hypothetical protein